MFSGGGQRNLSTKRGIDAGKEPFSAATQETRKKGFTLAEVLITLGIIGVVAAMTLPAIVNKSQEMILKQQFKKVYNTWSNALQRSYVNNGMSWYECYYAEDAASKCIEHDPITGSCIKYEYSHGYDKNSQCLNLFGELKTILKVVKACDNNAYKQGCIPDMKGYDTVLVSQSGDEDKDEGDYDILEQTSGCASFREANIKTQNPAWVLADGTVVGFYKKLEAKIFWIDINGHKKPNKWGHDIFTFSLKGDGHKKVYLSPVGCMKPEAGGKSTAAMLNDLYN